MSFVLCVPGCPDGYREIFDAVRGVCNPPSFPYARGRPYETCCCSSGCCWDNCPNADNSDEAQTCIAEIAGAIWHPSVSHVTWEESFILCVPDSEPPILKLKAWPTDTPELTTFRGRANVTVAWQDAPVDGSGQLWLAVYSPPGYRNYLRYTNVSAVAGEWTTEVLAAREPIVFKLWHGALGERPSAGTLLGTSDQLLPDGAWPTQLRTTLMPDPTDGSAVLRVSWTTSSSSLGAVLFGEASDSLDREAKEVARPISYSLDELKACDTADSTAKSSYFSPGYFHSILLTGLRPGAPVYYSVQGHGETYRHNGVPSSVAESVSFIYTADVGIGPSDLGGAGYEYGVFDESGWSKTRQSVGPGSGGGIVLKAIAERENLERAAFLMVNGDISYACGSAWIHEKFHELVAPIVSRVPLFTSMGNHEFDYRGQGFKPSWAGDAFGDGESSGGECGIPYRKRWMMPQADLESSESFKDTQDGSVPFYSFEASLLHVAVLSIEVDFTEGSPQHNWLKRDLSAVDRSRTPYVVVIQHREIYTAESDDDKFNPRVQAALEPLFIEHQVDLNIGAHIHEYERTCAMREGQCVEGGTTYIVDGTAGAYPQGGPRYPLPQWSIVSNDHRLGYSRITADGSGLTVERLLVPSLEVADSVIIPNKHGGASKKMVLSVDGEGRLESLSEIVGLSK